MAKRARRLTKRLESPAEILGLGPEDELIERLGGFKNHTFLFCPVSFSETIELMGSST